MRETLSVMYVELGHADHERAESELEVAVASAHFCL